MKGFSGASHRGYTEEQGGLYQAQKDYESYSTSHVVSKTAQMKSGEKLEDQLDQETTSNQVLDNSLSKKKERPISWEKGDAKARKRPRVELEVATASRLNTLHEDKLSVLPVTPSRAPSSSSSKSSEDAFEEMVLTNTSLSKIASAATRQPQHIEQGDDAELTLMPEQQRVIDKVMSGENVFFTGSAGTGKSTIMRHLIRVLKSKGKKVDIIAPTGRAALAVGGTTDFIYAGWIPDSFRRPIEELESQANGKLVWKRLNATGVLIIDEISMMENLRFERLNRIMMSARRNDLPFGGVQLVVTGDWCQLPPVKPFQYCLSCGKQLKASLASHRCKVCKHRYWREDRWAFRSDSWKRCSFNHINLTEIHRQSDPIFVSILEKYRHGNPLSQKERSLLLDHESETTDAVQLLPKRAEVAEINETAFAKLSEPILHFTASDDFECNHEEMRSKEQRNNDGSLKALADHTLEYELDLRIGTLVVLVANLDLTGGLVNGSQGIIIGFEKHNDNIMAGIERRYSSRASELLHNFVEQTSIKEWPIVRFTGGREMTIHPICRMNELGYTEPYSFISRTQIPLIPAWALTIHKAQGMTLDKVIVNLSSAFEEGQAYVALSRARSLKGLKVEALENQDFTGNPEVKEWYRDTFGVE